MAWIRSQDRLNLIDVTFLSIRRNMVATQDIWIITASWGQVGSFSSLERAQAELDSIERWIKRGAEDVYQISQEHSVNNK